MVRDFRRGRSAGAMSILANAARPSAGFSQAEFLVLEGRNRRPAAGNRLAGRGWERMGWRRLQRAAGGGAVLPSRRIDRYAEPDKPGRTAMSP
jgi:hypothetical protein